MSILQSSRKMTAREEVAFELGRMQGKHDATNWISVKERLPINEKPVLAYYGFDHGDGDLGMKFMGTLSYFCFEQNPHWQHAGHNLVVTHWMPLPDPPKEEEK